MSLPRTRAEAGLGPQRLRADKRGAPKGYTAWDLLPKKYREDPDPTLPTLSSAPSAQQKEISAYFTHVLSLHFCEQHDRKYPPIASRECSRKDCDGACTITVNCGATDRVAVPEDEGFEKLGRLLKICGSCHHKQQMAASGFTMGELLADHEARRLIALREKMMQDCPVVHRSTPQSTTSSIRRKAAPRVPDTPSSPPLRSSPTPGARFPQTARPPKRARPSSPEQASSNPKSKHPRVGDVIEISDDEDSEVEFLDTSDTLTFAVFEKSHKPPAIFTMEVLAVGQVIPRKLGKAFKRHGVEVGGAYERFIPHLGIWKSMAWDQPLAVLNSCLWIVLKRADVEIDGPHWDRIHGHVIEDSNDQ
ncbi:hypothetical protein BDZ89DRAFT_1046901 [Hymenopellis radicata]|nr:hypothetical protein BDZ89DRAFT_1051142 [Hymenopellis radicata]KAF9012935.1 hypothetical protein BDZ89DRAFT_1046901 [Hymenopellis radicata]